MCYAHFFVLGLSLQETGPYSCKGHVDMRLDRRPDIHLGKHGDSQHVCMSVCYIAGQESDEEEHPWQSSGGSQNPS